jgi:hypothetical protein
MLPAWLWNGANDGFGHLKQQGQGAENFVTAGVRNCQKIIFDNSCKLLRN